MTNESEPIKITAGRAEQGALIGIVNHIWDRVNRAVARGEFHLELLAMDPRAVQAIEKEFTAAGYKWVALDEKNPNQLYYWRLEW